MQRHVAVLRSVLRAEEGERIWIRAERLGVGHGGALLLTERRLLFSGLGFLTQSQESWPLATVEPGGVTRTGGAAVLSLRIAGVPETFAGRARDLESLAALLGEPAAEQPRTVADQLERLAALHASGALTDAEFAASKRRLLE